MEVFETIWGLIVVTKTGTAWLKINRKRQVSEKWFDTIWGSFASNQDKIIRIQNRSAPHLKFWSPVRLKGRTNQKNRKIPCNICGQPVYGYLGQMRVVCDVCEAMPLVCHDPRIGRRTGYLETDPSFDNVVRAYEESR